MKRTIYRDSETGRFAKRSTWNRSKAQGGTRYKRETVTVVSKLIEGEEFVDEWEEWIVDFEHEGT